MRLNSHDRSAPPDMIDGDDLTAHTPRNRCVRFVFGVAAASRNTRFQAAR